MKTRKKKSKSNRLEKLYKRYFVPISTVGAVDESASLQQPSIYKSVETITTCGAGEEAFVYGEMKQNA